MCGLWLIVGGSTIGGDMRRSRSGRQFGVRVAPLLLLGVMALAPGSSASAAAPQCQGRPATLVGTLGDDILQGTPGPDVIVGLAGDDRIFGANGNDVICGGLDNDFALGGRGDDRLIGGLARDGLVGSAGSDVVLGGAGRDTLVGGRGDDVLRGGADSDSVLLDRGDDFVSGGAGNDDLSALAGRKAPLVVNLTAGTAVGLGHDRVVRVEDVFLGRRAPVFIVGTNAANQLEALGRPVVIRGRGGNDVLHGGRRADRLFGGRGDDTIEGGFGDDFLDGGAGTDTLMVALARIGVREARCHIVPVSSAS